MSDQVKKDPLARKLTKILKNGDEWSFTWAQGTQTASLKSNEAAKPDLIQALEKLHFNAVDAAPWLAKDFHDKAIVIGVNMDWKGDSNRRNAEVVFSIKGKHIKIKTDKMLADNELDEKKKIRWPEPAVQKFDVLEREAFAYIDGDRQQMTMPLLSPENKNPNEPEMDFDDEIGTEE